VPDDDDKRAPALTQPSVASRDQFRANTSALDVGIDGHWPESATLDLADLKGAVHDVPDESPFVEGHERQLSAAIGSERVDDRALMLLAEGAAIQIADRRDVFRLLLSDLDHVGLLSAERNGVQPRGARAPRFDLPLTSARLVGCNDGMDSSRCMTSRIMVLFGQP
jgi:hypothetical protein